MPNGAAGRHLLGVICKETGRRAAAVAHFTAALTADPFLWSAYEELCALGAEDEAEAVVHHARPEHLYLPLAALGVVGFVEAEAGAEAAAAARGAGVGFGGFRGGGGATGGVRGGDGGGGASGGGDVEGTPVMGTPVMGTPMMTPHAGLRAPATMRPPVPLFSGLAPDSVEGAASGG